MASEHETLDRDHAGNADYVDVIIVANLESYLGTQHPLASADLDKVPAFRKLGLEPHSDVVDVEAVAETRAALG